MVLASSLLPALARDSTCDCSRLVAAVAEVSAEAAGMGTLH